MIAEIFRGQGRGIIGAVAGLALAALVGCTTTVTPTTPVPAPTSPVTTTPPMMTPSPAAAPAMGTEVKVTLTNGKVAMDMSTVTAGPARFMVRNDGTVAHDFFVEGQGVSKGTPRLEPGASATLEVTLTPGQYEGYCSVPGHRERGMTMMFTAK